MDDISDLPSIDINYEFDAPKRVSFGHLDDNESFGDEWFDVQAGLGKENDIGIESDKENVDFEKDEIAAEPDVELQRKQFYRKMAFGISETPLSNVKSSPDVKCDLPSTSAQINCKPSEGLIGNAMPAPKLAIYPHALVTPTVIVTPATPPPDGAVSSNDRVSSTQEDVMNRTFIVVTEEEEEFKTDDGGYVTPQQSATSEVSSQQLNSCPPLEAFEESENVQIKTEVTEDHKEGITEDQFSAVETSTSAGQDSRRRPKGGAKRAKRRQSLPDQQKKMTFGSIHVRRNARRNTSCSDVPKGLTHDKNFKRSCPAMVAKATRVRALNIQLTLPRTPEVLRRQVNINVKKSSQNNGDVLNFKSIQRKLKIARLNNEKTMAIALKSPVLPSRNVLPPTKPQNIQFKTDSRLHQSKSSDNQTKSTNAANEPNFQNSLRQYESPGKVGERITKTKPFQFADRVSRSRSMEATKDDENSATCSSKIASQYRSAAEMAIQFEQNIRGIRLAKTPNSSRQSSRSASSEDLGGTSRHVMEAKTPILRAVNRNRPLPADVISHSEKEDKEAAEVKRYNFRAKPVDKKMFESPTIGINRQKENNCTVPIPFVFETDKRLEVRLDKAETNPKAIIDKVANEIIKPTPVPDFSEPFKPKLEKKITAPEPFGFDNSIKERRKRKEEWIEEELAKQKAQPFTALPCPTDTPDRLPPKRARPATAVAPFHFASDCIAQQHKEKIKVKIEAEERERKEKANFKAQEASVLQKEPFVAHHEPAKPTGMAEGAAVNVTLHSDQRAKEREDFERAKAQRQLELDAAVKEIEAQKKAEEDTEIRRLRNEVLIHKAQPMPKFKAPVIKPADVPLTVPQSPNFSKRFLSSSITK